MSQSLGIMRPSGRRARFWAAEEAGTKQLEARNYLSQRSTRVEEDVYEHKPA